MTNGNSDFYFSHPSSLAPNNFLKTKKDLTTKKKGLFLIGEKKFFFGP